MHFFNFRQEVMLPDAGCKPDFLKVHSVHCCGVGFLFLPVFEFPVVEEFADRRIYIRRYFDQVQPRLARGCQSIFYAEEPELLALVVDYADGPRPDAFVNPQFV